MPFPIFGQLEIEKNLALKITEFIEVDGYLNESAWKNAPDASHLMQFEPDKEKHGHFNTTVKILYDNKFIYFGFSNYDPRPNEINSTVTDEDKDLRIDDSVYVLIDLFHDNEFFYFIGTNLLGTRLDGKITLDGQIANVAWDAVWKTMSQKTDFGWSTEIAIAISSLEYDPKNDITMGLCFSRIIGRAPKSIFWEGPLDPAFKISLLGDIDRVYFFQKLKTIRFSPHIMVGSEKRMESWWELMVPTKM